MNSYTFLVQGSSSAPYEVTIEKDGDILRAFCDCPAGNKGQYCKHRFSLLEGSDKAVVGGDTSIISELPKMLIGTDVGLAIDALAGEEAELAKIKKRVTAAKKAVAVAMRT